MSGSCRRHRDDGGTTAATCELLLHAPALSTPFCPSPPLVCGFPKDSSGYYRAWWIPGSTAVSLLPASWNSPVAPGQTLSVVAFTAGASVELFVNGASQGTQNVTAFGAATFNGVVYQPGNASATSYDATGKAIATTTIFTTGPAVALRVSCDAGSDTISADGQDVSLVRVEVVDAAGNVVPDASPVLTYTATGAGAIYVSPVGCGLTRTALASPGRSPAGRWQRRPCRPHARQGGLPRPAVRRRVDARSVQRPRTRRRPEHDDAWVYHSDGRGPGAHVGEHDHHDRLRKGDLLL